MGRAYYYFAASLPSLDFGVKPPLSCQQFLIESQRFVVKDDYILIKTLLEEQESSVVKKNAVARQWSDFSKNLCNQLAWTRAEAVHKNPLEFVRGQHVQDLYLTDLINQAKKEDDLLEAETILDRARWQFLEDLDREWFFTLESLIIYGLKLKILARQQEFQSEKGREALEEYQKVSLP